MIFIEQNTYDKCMLIFELHTWSGDIFEETQFLRFIELINDLRCTDLLNTKDLFIILIVLLEK